MRRALLLLAVALCCAALCWGCPKSEPTGKTPVNPDNDPRALDERPKLGKPKPYRAIDPTVYQTPEGMKVWLVERPEVPMVSLALTLPRGSAEDPAGKAGLAHITASMLDEGAGDRDAIAISTAINDLGAQMDASVDRDGSRITLTVLKKYLPQAFEIFADVVARPRFDPAEWKRVSDLWKNQLKRRADNPQAVAMVVSTAALYGPDTPYGHAPGGHVDTAETMSLGDVKNFYKRTWRPDEALLVVGGAVTRAELDALIQQKLGTWKKPKEPVPVVPSPPAPLSTRPRLVLVDRPDAPQAVIAAVGPGIAAADPSASILDLVNTALGGSFTSRLNQNLREDRGWSYGARSSFVETRGVGPFVAQSAVFVNVTAPAVREVLTEIEKMATSGLTEDEFVKVRARDLTSLIETHETVDSLVGRLSSLALLGLPYDYDAKASTARQQASRAAVAKLAATHLDPSKLSVIVVGPKKEVLPPLKSLGLGEPEMWNPEGRPLR